MAETKWTEQQRSAIEDRRAGILVNAAAGSGKTAVLSRRVAALIEEGGQIDRLLVVTFTRAAAAEMRQRIEKALSESYERTGSERIREQKLLAGTAKICTIDSFVSSLLRENFQQASLPPDFSVLDKAEEEAIFADCLEELLEEEYAVFSPELKTAVAFLGGEGDDQALSEALKQLYEFLSTLPFPETWKEEILLRNSSASFWIDEVCNFVRETLDEILAAYRALLASGNLPQKKIPLVEKETAFLTSLCTLAGEKQWDRLCREVRAFSFDRLTKVSDPSPEWTAFKAYRGQLKDFLDPAVGSFGEAFLISESDLVKETEKTKPAVSALFILSGKLSQKIENEYQKRNRYSFSSLSRRALNLLCLPGLSEDGQPVPTPLGKKIAAGFDEVLIDEYQDVNDLQDLLFCTVGKNGETLFVVGDVKQSIYGFRQSNPKNFIARKQTLHCIDLNKNFRSRPGILFFSNYVFSHLFHPRVAGISYGEGERLVPGLLDEKACGNVELCLLEKADIERQARFCAGKIKAMIASGETVTDKETRLERRLDYSDFAILLRARKPLETFFSVFSEEGIPLISPDKHNFWNLPEVQTVLAMLSVINNPTDDSALFAVLFSEMFRFTADEIALLRQGENAEKALSSAVFDRADRDIKCAEFTRLFRHFVILSRNLPVYKLIWQVLVRTGYLDRVSLLENGEAKRESLFSLYAFARSHPSADHLLKFLRLAALSAQTAGDSEKQELSGRAVRILTMHASKGLEFPVCILPLLERTSRGEEPPLILNETYGLGLRVRDDGMTYQLNTLQRKLIAAAEKKKNAAEELRLLYVALTRPRDRLILVASPTQTLKKALPEKCMLFSPDGLFSPSALCGANSLISLLLPVLARHPCADELRPEDCPSFAPEGSFTVSFSGDELEKESSVAESPVVSFSLSEEEMRRRFSFSYPGLLTRVPAKVSVTELSKGFLPDPDSVPLIPESELRKPDFLRDTSLSGAERGTAVHTFLRFADFSLPPEEEISRLVRDDYLSEAQAESLSLSRLNRFLKGPVPALVSGAEKVLREEGFVVEVPARFYPGAPENAKGEILMQGAIDLLCFLKDGLILVDYKTDSLPPEKLLSKYTVQLRLYAYAAEKMFSLKVKKAYLWSFSRGELIEVSLF